MLCLGVNNNVIYERKKNISYSFVIEYTLIYKIFPPIESKERSIICIYMLRITKGKVYKCGLIYNSILLISLFSCHSVILSKYNDNINTLT